MSVVAVATISHAGTQPPPDLFLPNRGCLRLGTAYMPCVPTASLCECVAFSVKKIVSLYQGRRKLGNKFKPAWDVRLHTKHGALGVACPQSYFCACL